MGYNTLIRALYNIHFTIFNLSDSLVGGDFKDIINL